MQDVDTCRPHAHATAWLALLMLLAGAGIVSAQDDRGQVGERSSDEARTYVNARGGVASSNQNGRPEVCVEGAPVAVVSVEVCGTGAQVWHEDPAPEMAHFRLKGRFLSLPFARFWLQAFAGAGFAELSVGNDEPGFAFRGPSNALTSTAGAELSLSTRALMPLGKGLELIGDLSLAAAYLPHAERLITPNSKLQPTIALSLGVGF